MLVPTIVLIVGIVGTKFWPTGLLFPLFTALVLLVFTNSLGDKSLDLTSGDVFGDVGDL